MRTLESQRYSYVSVADMAVGAEFVGIVLSPETGFEFLAVLSIADAKKLLDDLQEQIRIAEWKPEGKQPTS